MSTETPRDLLIARLLRENDSLTNALRNADRQIESANHRNLHLRSENAYLRETIQSLERRVRAQTPLRLLNGGGGA